MENLEELLLCTYKTHTEHSPWLSWAVDIINYANPKMVISKNVRMSIITTQKLNSQHTTEFQLCIKLLPRIRSQITLY